VQYKNQHRRNIQKNVFLLQNGLVLVILKMIVHDSLKMMMHFTVMFNIFFKMKMKKKICWHIPYRDKGSVYCNNSVSSS